MLVRRISRLGSRSSQNCLGTVRARIAVPTLDIATCESNSVPRHPETWGPNKIRQLGRVRAFHATRHALELVTMNVPQMGDSISEGTLNEILKKPGEYAEQDEVLVSIETDKVNVEVRAEVAGVISEYHCQEGDDIAVGSKLVTLDTTASALEAKQAGDTTQGSAAADAEPSAAAAPSSEETTKTASASESESAQHSKRGHTPMIQFRHGKENREKLKQQEVSQHTSEAPQAGTPAQSFENRLEENFPSKADKDPFELPSMYGRPPISDAEAEAIEMGMRLDE